ncbi:MAG: hypothetical protein IPJ26_03970 [Bacteroidetes bacterium]|nr:hypothetical protein [Bacteroidota bacterium]
MVNGITDSIAHYYHEKGYLEKTILLRGGLEDGIAKEFSEDGRIITLTTYKNGFLLNKIK